MDELRLSVLHKIVIDQENIKLLGQPERGPTPGFRFQS
jgi:hypothetical protein